MSYGYGDENPFETDYRKLGRILMNPLSLKPEAVSERPTKKQKKEKPSPKEVEKIVEKTIDEEKVLERTIEPSEKVKKRSPLQTRRDKLQERHKKSTSKKASKFIEGFDKVNNFLAKEAGSIYDNVPILHDIVPRDAFTGGAKFFRDHNLISWIGHTTKQERRSQMKSLGKRAFSELAEMKDFGIEIAKKFGAIQSVPRPLSLTSGKKFITSGADIPRSIKASDWMQIEAAPQMLMLTNG